MVSIWDCERLENRMCQYVRLGDSNVESGRFVVQSCFVELAELQWLEWRTVNGLEAFAPMAMVGSDEIRMP